jgi:anti-anti-sigma factor
MEITARRTGEQLVLSLAGRMDGAGAQQVSAAIQQNLTDHDTVLIFDLGGVDYLSSAGLRVFQESARRMKERSGRIAVCNLRDFVWKLLESGGFLRVLQVFPTADAALAATAGSPGTAAEIRVSGNGWTLAAQHLAGTAGPLMVTGSLTALHDGNITAADIRPLAVPAGGFSTGIGAMAPSREAASPLLGEMVQAKGMVWWLPTDGNQTPDYFTAQDREESGMQAFSLFSASFSGPFTDLVRISSDRAEGMTLAEVYAAIFQYVNAKTPGFSGVCAVVLKATISGLCSSDLNGSVLAAAGERARNGPAAMPVGRTVTEYPLEGTVPEKVSVVDVKPKYGGDILIGIGFGVDPATAARSFPRKALAAISYVDARTGPGLFLYNKGMVFTGLQWDNAAPFEEQLAFALKDGEFSALHNLLNITTVRSAVAGILPISEIRAGD